MKKPERLKKTPRDNVIKFLIITLFIAGNLAISAVFCHVFTQNLLAHQSEEPYSSTMCSFYFEMDTIYLGLKQNLRWVDDVEYRIDGYYAKATQAVVCSDANKAFNALSKDYQLFQTYVTNIEAYSSHYDKVCTKVENYLDKVGSAHPIDDEYKLWIEEKALSISNLLADFRREKPDVEAKYTEAKQIADDFFEEYFDLMSRLANAECGTFGVPPEDRYYVCNVVENRIKSKRFPDNLYDVIYQEHQYTPTESGGIDFPATDDVKKDVEDYLRGRVETNMPEDVVFQSKKKLGDYVWAYMEVTQHYFCGKRL